MKGVFSAPGDYIHFKSQVPLHKIPIGSKLWRYYDFGSKEVPPLVCLPGTAETADVYYKQIMSLSMKASAAMGYLTPEYTTTGRFTEKSDVYAFGMIIFQILSGKQKITHLMRLGAESCKLEDVIDSNLRGKFSES